MRIQGSVIFFLGALAELIPLLLGARISPSRSAAAGFASAGVILETSVLQVEDGARPWPASWISGYPGSIGRR